MTTTKNKCHKCNYPISTENPICAYCGSQFRDLSDEISVVDYFSYHSLKDMLIYRSGDKDNLYLELEVKEELFRKFNEIHLIYRKFDRLNDLYTEISHTLQFDLRHIRVVPLSHKDKKLDIKNSMPVGYWKLTCQSPIGPQQIDCLCTQFSQFSIKQIFLCYEAFEKSVLEKFGMLYLSRFTIGNESPKCP